MKKNNKKQPIRLIYFDENKNVKLADEAIELFQQFNTSELHIITVAGRYRTGKSYILNRVLLGQNSGFEVGSTINACTKGLWMWPQLVKIQDGGKTKDCLIIDTQGLGSLQQGENTDIKIFILAILLSSYLIYNSVGNIDEKAIQNLGLVVNLANLMHKQNNNYDTQQLINSFPTFLWLVRDFCLRLQDVNGQTITRTEYLENALKHQIVKSQVQLFENQIAQRKNEVRKQLRTFFPNRDCFTLIRPTQNDIDLQRLSKLTDDRLRPQFVELINELKQKIFREVKPKNIRGKPTTPQGFIELCKYFIETINSGKLPSINSHWENLCLSQSKRIIQNYKLHHHQRLSLYENVQEMKAEHLKIVKEAENKIEMSFLGKLQKELSKERLLKNLTQIYQNCISAIKQKNHNKVKEILDTIFKQIIKEFKNKQIQSFQEIFERFETFKQHYRTDSKIYQLFYQNSKQVFNQFIINLEESWERQNSILTYRTRSLQNQIVTNSNKLQSKLQQYNNKLRQCESEIYKLQVQNQNIKIENQFLDGKVLKLQIQKNELINIIETNERRNYQNIEQIKVQLMNKHQNQKNNLIGENQHIQVQLAKLQQQYRTIQIKQRKSQRQGQIVKNKCTQYISLNSQLNQKIQQLQKHIQKLEQKQRSQKNITNKQIPQALIDCNKLIRQMEVQLKINIQEKKNLTSLLEDQKKTNQTLMKVSKNLNYMSMKKSYQIQKISNRQLKEKINELQIIILYCSEFECFYCNKVVQKNAVISHHHECISDRNVYFDVSYNLNGQGQIQYLIQVKVNQKQWVVTKNYKALRKLLEKLSEKLDLFENNHNSSPNINLHEQQRIYLKQTINGLGKRLWQQMDLVKFFGLDIHVLRHKKPTHPKITGLNLNLQQIPEECLNNHNTGLRTSRGIKKNFKFNQFV